MVNWHDPAIELFCAHVAIFNADFSAGAYLWEFLTCFAFDWQFITKRRPFRWTMIPYLLARYTSAVMFVLYGYTVNVYRPIDNCTVWWKAIFALGHCSLAASSVLLVIRVIAISENKRWIRGALGALWLAEAGTSIHSVVTVEGEYAPQLLACGAKNAIVAQPYMLVSLALHLACLAIVLLLLLRWRGAGLWGLLVSQGLVYFVASVVAHGSNSVLLLLNLNDSINLSLQLPCAAALVICATRMYRGLVTYSRPEMEFDGFTLTSAGVQAPGGVPQHNICIPRSFAAYSTTEDDLHVAGARKLTSVPSRSSDAVEV